MRLPIFDEMIYTLWPRITIALLLIIGSLFLGVNSAQAKDSTKPKNLYCESGVGGISGRGFNFQSSLNYTVLSNFELVVGFNYFIKEAKQTPSDYTDGGLLNFGTVLEKPSDHFAGATLGLSYRLLPPKSKYVSFVIRGEVLLGNTNTKTDFQTYHGGGLFSKNYVYKSVKGFDAGLKFSTGLQLNSSANHVGFHFTIFAMATPRFSAVGINLGVQLGRMNVNPLTSKQ